MVSIPRQRATFPMSDVSVAFSRGRYRWFSPRSVGMGIGSRWLRGYRLDRPNASIDLFFSPGAWPLFLFLVHKTLH
jgi:hypothetical protein